MSGDPIKIGLYPNLGALVRSSSFHKNSSFIFCKLLLYNFFILLSLKAETNLIYFLTCFKRQGNATKTRVVVNE